MPFDSDKPASPFYGGPAPQAPQNEPASPLSDVTVPCEAYVQNAPKWQRVRRALEGTDAMKEGGYLPVLEGHKANRDLAAAYADRAVYVNYAARTLEALTGAIFRKEGNVKVPKRYEPRLANMNNRGDQLYNFAKKIARQVIAYGRVGVLLDYGNIDAAKRKAIDFTPYMVDYGAESILSWRTRDIGGSPMLDQVILREERIEPKKYGFAKVQVYRVLELDNDGLYFVQVIEGRQGRLMIVREEYPLGYGEYGSKPLDFIPFVFIGPNDLSPDVSKPPLLDLVDVNISHYRSSADLEQGRFYTSQPTPVILGVSEDQQGSFRELPLGSSTVWLLPPSVTEVKLLEYTGDGLGSLERALEQKERQMAQMGARLLAEPRRTAEAAETVRLRNVAETSTLAAIARTVSDGIRTLIEMSSRWAGIDASEPTRDGPGEGKIEFELNQDFIDTSIERGMLAEFVKAWVDGGITKQTLFWNLQRYEVIPPGMSYEEFEEALDREGPQFARTLLQLAPKPADEAEEKDEAGNEEGNIHTAEDA